MQTIINEKILDTSVGSYIDLSHGEDSWEWSFSKKEKSSKLYFYILPLLLVTSYIIWF